MFKLWHKRSPKKIFFCKSKLIPIHHVYLTTVLVVTSFATFDIIHVYSKVFFKR